MFLSSLCSPSTLGDGSLNERLSQVYQELEAIEADKAPAQAAVILCGLGFSLKMQKAATKLVKFPLLYYL